MQQRGRGGLVVLSVIVRGPIIDGLALVLLPYGRRVSSRRGNQRRRRGGGGVYRLPPETSSGQEAGISRSEDELVRSGYPVGMSL